jgi:hypothetical protein
MCISMLENTSWIFRGKSFFDSDIPDDVIGFTYLITNLNTGRAYIGKKLFWRSIKVIRKGKRPRRVRKPSNWQDYYGSCQELLEDIEIIGKNSFSREILALWKSKGDLSLAEMTEQIQRDVLHHPDKYYNSYVGGRIHRKHLKPLS